VGKGGECGGDGRDQELSARDLVLSTVLCCPATVGAVGIRPGRRERQKWGCLGPGALEVQDVSSKLSLVQALWNGSARAA
jgi:hypothetical protein